MFVELDVIAHDRDDWCSRRVFWTLPGMSAGSSRSLACVERRKSARNGCWFAEVGTHFGEVDRFAQKPVRNGTLAEIVVGARFG